MVGILGSKLPLLLQTVEQYRPASYVEIGCYRCDTMKAVKAAGVPRVVGFDLFEPAPPEEDPPRDGPPVTIQEAIAMGFEVYQGDSKKTLIMLTQLNLAPPVLVFIDGGHSEETVLWDYKNITRYLPGAIVLLDDADYPACVSLLRKLPPASAHFLTHCLALIRPVNGALPLLPKEHILRDGETLEQHHLRRISSAGPHGECCR